ncbi:GntR family transcriptional regulator [Streptomyces sp. AV19]|uniref:GntR family transcriptional regulator n=1 Tax=Streptomyces sp. AV19 TaxID=2793068 RepID=UPI0018FEED95|nr:GntR family transcriptional regulator [Streptomyces sp. AV19]MBH1933012.1 GntR family transcriptional regulator [Streptomyces sp. AV19]MDG4531725.1 GntR family transcriptional regulator [Streptomyces sp. AV19]
MLVTIDHASRVPLAEQIAACVRRQLADGSLRPGERLPAARALARTLDVNVHTVLRAYQLLQAERLLELRPGRGAVVSADAPASRALAVEACRRFVRLARREGLSEGEAVAMVREEFGRERG